MNVTFEVTKEDVLLQVKTESYLTGESLKEGDDAQKNRATKMQCSDDDDYILSKYIDTAASVINDILTGHLTHAEFTKEDAQTVKGNDTILYKFICDVPSTYDMNQNRAIEEGIRDYMAAYCLYRWNKRVNPEMADPSELQFFRSDINHRINQRTRPVRRPVLPPNF